MNLFGPNLWRYGNSHPFLGRALVNHIVITTPVAIPLRIISRFIANKLAHHIKLIKRGENLQQLLLLSLYLYQYISLSLSTASSSCLFMVHFQSLESPDEKNKLHCSLNRKSRIHHVKILTQSAERIIQYIIYNSFLSYPSLLDRDP